MNIEAFILARVAEDEAIANASLSVNRHRALRECVAKRALLRIHTPEPSSYPEADPFPFGCSVCDFHDNMQFGYGPCETVLVLARIWSDHPDFDPAWAQA